MPNPVIQGASRTRTVPRVYIKKNWFNEWILSPRLKPQAASRYLSPRIGKCDFLVYYGYGNQPGDPTKNYYPPLAIDGYYIKITNMKDGSNEETLDWVGVIANISLETHSSTSLVGIERIVAFTLEYLLEKVIIHKAYATQPGVGEIEIDWAPSFNQRDKYDRGERQIDPTTQNIIGNKEAGESRFGAISTSQRWNAEEAISYLLSRFGPGLDAGVVWELGGQTEPLDNWIEVWPQQGMSLRAILDSMMNLRIGLTWAVETTGENTIIIRTQTMLNVSITIGTVYIPANDRQAAYTIPTSLPERHIFPTPIITYDEIYAYDKIIIEGALVKMVGTWSIIDASLEKGWTAALEAEYITSAGANGREKDNYRSSPAYAKVFQHFVVPAAFSGNLGNGKGENISSVLPTPNDTGELDFFDGPIYVAGKTFLKYLPFLEGFLYHINPPTDTNPVGSEPGYLSAAVFLQDPFDGLYVRELRMHEKQQYLHPSQTSILDKRFGIELRCQPNHHNAHASSGAHIPIARRGPNVIPPLDTTTSNQIDYRKLAAVLFVELDVRPRIVYEVSEPSERKSELVVTVDQVQYWFAHPQTIVDLNDAGQFVYIAADLAAPNYLRKDKTLLETIAVFVRSWGSKRRQAISLTVGDVGYGPSISPEVGTYITSIVGVATREDVNAIVSGVTMDYHNGVTQFETEFLSLTEGVEMVKSLSARNNL